MDKNIISDDGKRTDYKKCYICDLCGMDIVYDEDWDKYKNGAMTVPHISGFSINNEGETNWLQGWRGNICFHPSCFKELIKPILLKKKKASGGYIVGLIDKEGNKIREFDPSIYIKESQLRPPNHLDNISTKEILLRLKKK